MQTEGSYRAVPWPVRVVVVACDNGLQLSIIVTYFAFFLSFSFSLYNNVERCDDFFKLVSIL